MKLKVFTFSTNDMPCDIEKKLNDFFTSRTYISKDIAVLSDVVYYFIWFEGEDYKEDFSDI